MRQRGLPNDSRRAAYSRNARRIERANFYRRSYLVETIGASGRRFYFATVLSFNDSSGVKLQ